ncbi:MAG: DUF2796 domain-containing protein [Deltaproteobacteria bacterium]|jgi:hypothetical protein|nr:DUF2796 domain-containing protein [Deltaproteobacteria bacterium]
MRNAVILSAVLAGLWLAQSAGPAFGQTHGAHEHGKADLNVAVEGGRLEIELDGPLASFISFEHEPTTDAQRDEVKDLAAKLGRAEELFKTPAAAGCRAVSASLSSANLPAELLAPFAAEGRPDHDHDGEAEDHGHDDADHDHDGEADDLGHDDADHDHDGEAADHGHDDIDHDHDDEAADHGPDDADHDHEGEGHGDLEAVYVFECAKPAALNRVEVGLFEVFSALQELETGLISDQGQKGFELVPGQAVIQW